MPNSLQPVSDTGVRHRRGRRPRDPLSTRGEHGSIRLAAAVHEELVVEENDIEPRSAAEERWRPALLRRLAANASSRVADDLSGIQDRTLATLLVLDRPDEGATGQRTERDQETSRCTCLPSTLSRSTLR